MQRSVMIAIAIVCAVVASHAQSTSAVEQEILTLEKDYEVAYLKKDRAGLGEGGSA